MYTHFGKRILPGGETESGFPELDGTLEPEGRLVRAGDRRVGSYCGAKGSALTITDGERARLEWAWLSPKIAWGDFM